MPFTPFHFGAGALVHSVAPKYVSFLAFCGANVHLVIGRKSFDERTLLENYATVVEEIVRAKPAAAKGRYIRSITLTSSMGPGIHVDPTRTREVTAELEEEPVPA